ncbi:hypothetical protein ABZ401_19105 [Streptomyces sp. NPDC005892]|uniref:hypothetical protein n=1 Tax=Streptomyces sp. NPDC005892 TaxID=3155593 RepID=UPI0033E4AFAE
MTLARLAPALALAASTILATLLIGEERRAARTTPKENRMDRTPLDDLTSDQLDELYDDLDRYEEVQGEMNERAVDLTRRVAELEAEAAEHLATHEEETANTAREIDRALAAGARVTNLVPEAAPGCDTWRRQNGRADLCASPVCARCAHLRRL